MNTLERARVKHNTFATDVSKLALRRDKALDALIRAEARYRKAVKAVGRSSKRLDKLREQARNLKALKAKPRHQVPADPQLNDIIGI
jgi:hypothetical protein